MAYGYRIKTLAIDAHMSSYLVPSQGLQEIAWERPALCITPNLRHISLAWTRNDFFNAVGDRYPTDVLLDICFLVLHDRVKRLSLRLSSVDFSGRFYNRLQSIICRKAASVQHIEIGFSVDVCDSGPYYTFLDRILLHLRNLRSILLPPDSLTAQLLNLLKDRSGLEKIGLSDGCSVTCTKKQVKAKKQMKGGKGKKSATPTALPLPDILFCNLQLLSLVELHVQISFNHATKLDSSDFPNLRILHMRSHIAEEDMESISELLQHISATLPQLKALSIETFERDANIGFLPPAPTYSESLSYDVLQPLSSMKQLKEFSLKWPTPMSGSNQDLMKLLMELPGIERLSLNNSPSASIEQLEKLTLDVLPLIGNRCRLLRHLALFIGCSAAPAWHRVMSWYSDEGEDRSFSSFGNLQSLDLGLSPVSPTINRQSLALWLSSFIPPACELRSSSLRKGPTGNRWPDICTEVGNSIKILSTARMEERKIANAQKRLLEERIRELESVMKEHL